MYRRGFGKFGLAAFGLLLGFAVQASETLRVDNQVLSVGDSAVRAIDLLGKPAYQEPVETGHGGYLGQRWQYSLEGRVVTVVIVDGKVADITDRNA
jgi:hypothetical protein